MGCKGKMTYVLGLGVISAAGNDLMQTVDTMRAGVSHTTSVRRFPTMIKAPVGEVHLSDSQLKDLLGIPECEMISRTALLGIKAVRDAIEDFQTMADGIGNMRVAFISGTSVGGMDLSEVFWQSHRENLEGGDAGMLRMHDPGGVTMAIDGYFRSGKFPLWRNVVHVTTISTACSAAGNAIMLGARMIEAGMVDCVVAGGTDALCKFTLNGFNSLRILDEGQCRPFDAGRNGLNLGEGAGYMVLAALPRDIGQARSYCRICGWGNANEAYHQTASTPDGIGPGLAMEAALHRAGMRPDEIQFINTHGTGTQVNDSAELNAMGRVFRGSIPPYSSLKPYLGHTLGASEGIEAALCCHALASDDFTFMKSTNWLTPADGCASEPYDGRRLAVDNVMSSAFGFSGNCVSLIFSKCTKS